MNKVTTTEEHTSAACSAVNGGSTDWKCEKCEGRTAVLRVLRGEP